MSFIPQPNEIARGTAGDCCILCGKVGINLPDDHGCKPNTDVDAYRAQRAAHAERWSWEAAWTRTKPRETPQVQPVAIPTAGRLAGILRKVASTGEGKRQAIGFWAAGKLLEGNYPAAAWDALEAAMRSTGASNHDIRTALRERPGGRVHA